MPHYVPTFYNEWEFLITSIINNRYMCDAISPLIHKAIYKHSQSMCAAAAAAVEKNKIFPW